MRGLNLAGFVGDSSAWEVYQRQSVDRQLATFLKDKPLPRGVSPVVEPLFPGSMMFSHIVVFNGQNRDGTMVADSLLPELPDTFDSYYSSFSKAETGGDLSNSVLVDCGGGTMATIGAISADNVVKKVEALTSQQLQSVECRIEELCRENSAIDTLVFLQAPCYHSFKNAYKGNLNVRLHQPDWHRFADVFFLYRKSAHVVFVNNMRVLDAAFCACDCSIVAGDQIDAMRFSALLSCIAGKSCCEVLAEPGQGNEADSKSIAERQVFGAFVSDNNQQAFHAALSDLIEDRTAFGSIDENDIADLFEIINHEAAVSTGKTRLVIDLSGFVTSTLRGRLANKRIKLIRKTNKLREDPRSFCRDSSNVIVRTIGSVLPLKKSVSG